jgi:hypothetical protein
MSELDYELECRVNYIMRQNKFNEVLDKCINSDMNESEILAVLLKEG